ncbi:MAG: transposase [Bryobacteraceae bacterium]|jgi:hypothetical protein
MTIAADPQHLGAELGFLAVLHTWGQNLHIHPHIHCVVPGGGISQDGSRWIAPRKNSFFLPVKVLSCLFRKKFLSLKRRDRCLGSVRADCWCEERATCYPGFVKVATDGTRVGASTARPVLRSAPDESMPSEQEKAAAAKRAVWGCRSHWKAISRVLRAPTLVKSMDRQCGQRVEKSPTAARIMGPFSPHRLRQDRGGLGKASNRVRGGRLAGWPQRGSLRAPPLVVPVSSGQAPTGWPALSLAEPDACVASVIFCPFVSSIYRHIREDASNSSDRPSAWSLQG